MSSLRIGSSIDTHRLIPTNKETSIKIGGVKFDTTYLIDSISDGDVVFHSVAEAIFGSMGLGDLGEWFPESTTPINYDSQNILLKALEELKKKRGSIINIDLIVICKDIYLGDRKKEIKKSLVKIIGSKNINVKGTRGEDHSDSYISCLSTVLISLSS